MMKCEVCEMKFHDGEKILPVIKYVTNEKRGDFASSPIGYIHLFHIQKEN